MKPANDLLTAASQAAFAVLAHKADCFEVFVRSGETLRLTRDFSQARKERAFEFGVTCRCRRLRFGGFGAASGPAKYAGETAARLALKGLSDGHPPLPPPQLLGAVPTPQPLWLSDQAFEEQFHALAAAASANAWSMSLVRSQTLFHRGEGFTALWANQLLLVQWTQELLPGVQGTFSRVFMPPQRFSPPTWQTLLFPAGGWPSLSPGRFLGPVLLSPDVAAPLLVSLARTYPWPNAVPSASWELWDLRTGTDAFLPMACDGDGLPSQNYLLLSARRSTFGKGLGQNPEPPSTRATLAAIRLPWDAPPTPAPVHLWQPPNPNLPLTAALAQLDKAFVAVAPVSEVALEGSGRFRMVSVVIQLAQGKPRSCGVGVLRGSMKRLIQGLGGTVGEQEHLGLGCVVSTPWLLVSHLEVDV